MKPGDFIVEHQTGRRAGKIDFGVIMGVEDRGVLDVIFPMGRLYTFEEHCQPYLEWLSENGF